MARTGDGDTFSDSPATSDAQLSAVSADGRIRSSTSWIQVDSAIGGGRDRGFDLGVLLGGRLLGLAKPFPYLSCLGCCGLRFAKRLRVGFDQLVGLSRGGCPQPGGLPQARRIAFRQVLSGNVGQARFGGVSRYRISRSLHGPFGGI